MPDLTVIEGGGKPKDWDREISQQYFEHFVVALLRSLASGEDSYRVRESFLSFLKHAQESAVPIGPVFDGAVRNLHNRAFGLEGITGLDEQRRILAEAALRVVAENMARDGFANARRLKREHELHEAIEGMVLEWETINRSDGQSYVARLTERLGAWPPRKK